MTNLMIDDATLSAAERLPGVRYTDAERAPMRDNLAKQVELAVRRRPVKLPNALPPATLFDPSPSCFHDAGPITPTGKVMHAEEVAGRNRGLHCEPRGVGASGVSITFVARSSFA